MHRDSEGSRAALVELIAVCRALGLTNVAAVFEKHLKEDEQDG